MKLLSRLNENRQKTHTSIVNKKYVKKYSFEGYSRLSRSGIAWKTLQKLNNKPSILATPLSSRTKSRRPLNLLKARRKMPGFDATARSATQGPKTASASQPKQAPGGMAVSSKEDSEEVRQFELGSKGLETSACKNPELPTSALRAIVKPHRGPGSRQSPAPCGRPSGQLPEKIRLFPASDNSQCRPKFLAGPTRGLPSH